MANIHGKEHPLRDIFSDQFAFSIPPFQRPYSWRAEHAEALINDLIAFMKEANSIKELPPYFLGSIVLIKTEGLPEAEVVDGQQRLTTLTILLAVLREIAPPEQKSNLTKFIYEEGNSIADTPNRYRLTLRERDSEFFQNYIQHEGGIQKLQEQDPATLSDSQKRLQTNALLLLEAVKTLSEEDCIHLAQAIIRRCYLVEISTSDLDSAYNVFSILNDRGLNISHADILKAQIIGKIPPKQRTRYTSKWEDTEELLGSTDFSDLFNRLNMIYSSNNTNYHPESLLANFRENVYPTAVPTYSPTQFIDEVFVPHAKALSSINQQNYKHSKDAKKINDILNWHSQIIDSISDFRGYYATDWRTTAMHYIAQHANESASILQFLIDFERLRVVLELQNDYQRRLYVRTKIRFNDVLCAIRTGKDLFSPESPLQITALEKESCIMTLNGDMYHNDLIGYIMLRLDRALSAATEPHYNHESITVEHVLPQKPKENSMWIRSFPDPTERADYVNRLGNLLLLSRSKNSEASNHDFTEKKRKYFFSKKGISSFAITTQVIQEETWTPEVIERRQKALINILKEIWRLN